MAQEFFKARPDVTPTIYAYELVGVSSHEGYLKVGYTDRNVETRIREQLHTSGVPYKIVIKEAAKEPLPAPRSAGRNKAALWRENFFKRRGESCHFRPVFWTNWWRAATL